MFCPVCVDVAMLSTPSTCIHTWYLCMFLWTLHCYGSHLPVYIAGICVCFYGHYTVMDPIYLYTYLVFVYVFMDITLLWIPSTCIHTWYLCMFLWTLHCYGSRLPVYIPGICVCFYGHYTVMDPVYLYTYLVFVYVFMDVTLLWILSTCIHTWYLCMFLWTLHCYGSRLPVYIPGICVCFMDVTLLWIPSTCIHTWYLCMFLWTLHCYGSRLPVYIPGICVCFYGCYTVMDPVYLYTYLVFVYVFMDITLLWIPSTCIHTWYLCMFL